MYLPAEWSRQSFVQLTMPHKETDWGPDLKEVLLCYHEIAYHISQHEPLLVVCQDTALANELLSDIPNAIVVNCPVNDTWSRDHGFITCIDDEECVFMDFQFNGWGLKFASNYDNQINNHLWESGILKGKYKDCREFVLEGGSIESDGQGTIMTTSSCLLGENRNNLKTKLEADEKLYQYLNARRVLWLNHGYLEGDDTDGHIDTLARFCPNDTIVHVTCDREDDPHYKVFQLMTSELSSFKTSDGKPYTLVGIPIPSPIYHDGERLPATYANYLVINGAVLYPTYGQPTYDEIARKSLSNVYPDREMIGIDCRVLLRQHGSLHCCTMQYPQP